MSDDDGEDEDNEKTERFKNAKKKYVAIMTTSRQTIVGDKTKS